jgi:16S rRNA (cytosine1402-N4)-methyltransferase
VSDDAPESAPRTRRVRYSGKYPRRFEEKYKERDPQRYGDTVAKVLESGKTPAGTHRPIMVAEILEVLAPRPGCICVDCTLGYGGHARELLRLVLPVGRVIGLDADPIELPRTESRLRGEGFGPNVFTAIRTNFAGLTQALHAAGIDRVDCILADLGVSSMQLDDPARGFSLKYTGPLDLRMNPSRGQPASHFLQKVRPGPLAVLLAENSDEPQAEMLAEELAGRQFPTTTGLATAIRKAIGARLGEDEREQTVRRVFQALRIEVNEEFTALDSLLRQLPGCLKPGGRVAMLTFHSGEDRRVKKAFAAGFADGGYNSVAQEVLRPSAAERHANPRSSSAKLRWAQRADA